MKEVRRLLKMVSDGLRTLAQGVEAMADKVDDTANTKSTAASQDKKQPVSLKSFQGESKAPKEAKKPAPKPAKQKAVEPATAKAAEPATAKAAKPATAKAAEPAIAKATEPATAKAAKPVIAKAAKPATAKAAKPAIAKVAKPATAMDTVLNIIGSSKTGINAAAIKNIAGYEPKKVTNIIYKLKKQGKIKAVKKGVYLKA